MKPVLSVLLLTALTGAAALFTRTYSHVDQKKSWNDAQKHCRENHEDLATIENQKELERFQRDVSTHLWYWTGLYRNETTQEFSLWSDGSTSGFRNWDSHEPEIEINYDSVFGEKHFFWYTYDGTVPLTFVCYTWRPEVIVVQEMKTWEEALKFCRMNYTDLISLDTDSDHLAIKNRTSEILTPRFWTSLRFLDGSWFWVNRASMDEQASANLNSMPSCPTRRFHCGARNTESNVMENRDCEEKMNFICYK